MVAATVTANVNDAGKPALGGVVGGVITRAGAAEIVTLTDPDDCPVAPGVVVPVPVPLPVPVPPVAGACAPTLAVTVAGRLVVSTVVATPSASAVASDVDKTPAVVEKLTGAELSALPLMSKTDAVMVVEPPVLGTDAGRGVDRDAADRRRADRDLDGARRPGRRAARNCRDRRRPVRRCRRETSPRTRPLMSVSASGGTIVPSVVVNATCVPCWGGVPEGSITCAMMSADPLTGSAVTPVVSVIVEPDGARSGTLSQVTLSARTAVSVRRHGNPAGGHDEAA